MTDRLIEPPSGSVPGLTPEELALIRDTHFFKTKTIIMKKVKQAFETLQAALREELAISNLLAPEEVDLSIGQFVKGEHLLDFPYQYLDLPKYFSQAEKFAFRSLFWWGHYVVFALILEGSYLDQHKQNLLKAYPLLADLGLHILMAPTLWEWERRPELLLEIRRDNRAAVEAALQNRTFLKIHRFIDFNLALFENGGFAEAGRTTFRLLKPIVTG